MTSDDYIPVDPYGDLEAQMRQHQRRAADLLAEIWNHCRNGRLTPEKYDECLTLYREALERYGHHRHD
jgi:hypothetical protein